jgi:hypothetical protein
MPSAVQETFVIAEKRCRSSAVRLLGFWVRVWSFSRSFASGASFLFERYCFPTAVLFFWAKLHSYFDTWVLSRGQTADQWRYSDRVMLNVCEVTGLKETSQISCLYRCVFYLSGWVMCVCSILREINWFNKKILLGAWRSVSPECCIVR